MITPKKMSVEEIDEIRRSLYATEFEPVPSLLDHVAAQAAEIEALRAALAEARAKALADATVIRWLQLVCKVSP